MMVELLRDRKSFGRDVLDIFTFIFFFFNDTATTEIYTRTYTLSLLDALPICQSPEFRFYPGGHRAI